MLTNSEHLTFPTSDTRTNSTTSIPAIALDPRLTYKVAPEENTTPSESLERPGWRLPLPQLARKSTPFKNLPDVHLGEKHRAAQDAATAGAVRHFNPYASVSEALDALKYLWFTKWSQTANPIDDWEIQDSGNWTTPPESIDGSTAVATPPASSVDTFSGSSMDISSTRPVSPASSQPTRFSFEAPTRIFINQVVEIHSDDGASSDSDSDDVHAYRRARGLNDPNPYLAAGATSQPTWGSPPPSPRV